jgi:hypothetical protein
MYVAWTLILYYRPALMERSNTQVRLDLLAQVLVFLHTFCSHKNQFKSYSYIAQQYVCLSEQCIHGTMTTLQLRGKQVFVTFPLSAVQRYSDVRVPCWNVEVDKLFVNTHYLQLLMPKVHSRCLIELKSR